MGLHHVRNSGTLACDQRTQRRSSPSVAVVTHTLTLTYAHGLLLTHPHSTCSHTRERTHSHICTCTHSHALALTCLCSHIHTHTLTHTQTQMYTCTRLSPGGVRAMEGPLWGQRGLQRHSSPCCKLKSQTGLLYLCKLYLIKVDLSVFKCRMSSEKIRNSTRLIV